MENERVREFEEKVEKFCELSDATRTEKMIAQRMLQLLYWKKEGQMFDDTQGFLRNLYEMFPKDEKSEMYKLIKDACEIFSREVYGDAFDPNDPFGF